jgi:hypothetical protein
LACQKDDREKFNNKSEIFSRWNQYFQEMLEGRKIMMRQTMQ